MQYIDIINVWLVALLNELIYNPLVINDFFKSWFPPMVWSRETSVDGLHSSNQHQHQQHQQSLLIPSKLG